MSSSADGQSRKYIPRNKRRGAAKGARFREQVLRDWLGCDDAADLEEGVYTADEVLGDLVKKLGLQDGVTEEDLKSRWRQTAGDFIANHAAPESLRNGILTLHVLQPAMRYHLEQSKAPLLERLQSELGAKVVRDIRFALG